MRAIPSFLAKAKERGCPLSLPQSVSSLQKALDLYAPFLARRALSRRFQAYGMITIVKA